MSVNGGAAAVPRDPLDRRSGPRYVGYKWALGGIAAAVQSLIYFGIGHAELARSTDLLRTKLDDAIPFLPWTAWCYLPFYAGVFIICIFGIRSRVIFHRALVGVGVVMLLGAFGHLFVGAEYPRPLLTPPYPDVSSAFLAAVQSIDPPGNVFPSLHVAHTSSLALILYRDRRGLGTLAIAMAAALAVSTLTTKQHFVADVLAGFLIAGLTRFFVLRRLPRAD